ncbi:MAG: tRNA (adenosine(37)-N6)-threonylcarbamoyltransferase complex dimerization subunit type 1 TsaB, partial [Desulfohalobiaceae bacterium]
MAEGPLLVVNGVESRLQIVLGDRDGLLWSHESIAPGRLMTRLAPALDWMFKTFDLSVADLGGIAAVRGPGSFTGVRLVLATVLGLSRGGAVPQAGLDYLPLLAAGPAGLLHGELWVCTHA